MANTNTITRTNYFRVTDEEKYQKLFEQLSSEDTIHDFTETVNGTVLHGFGSYTFIFYYPSDEYVDENGYSLDGFLEQLQKILPEGDAVIIKEISWEKLRFVDGGYYVITSNEYRYVSMDDAALAAAREMLSDETWTTQIDY